MASSINYCSETFKSVEDAVKFMNVNNIPHELVVSLTPSRYVNCGLSKYENVLKACEWVLIFNKTSELPFFR